MNNLPISEILQIDNLLILDTETTGLDSDAQVIQLAIIDIHGDTLFNELIKPIGTSSWVGAERVHGISYEMVENKKHLPGYYPQLHRILKGRNVAVYNALYDKRILIQSAKANCYHALIDLLESINWYDVMIPYAEYYKDWNSYRRSHTWQSLTNACSQQGIIIENAHDALGDCKMTLALLEKLKE